MTRKMLTASIAVLALLLSVLSIGAITDAGAQGAPTCPYYNAGIVTGAGACAKALAYPGPFTEMPTGPVGPYGFWAPSVVAAAPAAAADGAAPPAAGDTGGAPLAHTGSESTVLGYVGAGLIAFGAVALGSRRKFFQGALD